MTLFLGSPSLVFGQANQLETDQGIAASIALTVQMFVRLFCRYVISSNINAASKKPEPICKIIP